MNRSELMNYLPVAKKAYASKAMDYSLVSEGSGAYPHWDATTSECKPSMVRVHLMQQNGGTGKSHLVVLAYLGEDDYRIWCGDNFIEGGNCKPEADARVERGVQELPGHFSRTDGIRLLSSLRGYASGPSDACSFWRGWNSSAKLCKHCNQFLVQYASKLSDFLDELVHEYGIVIEGQQPSPVLPVTDTPELGRLLRKAPVLLEGEKGWGKSREARILAEALNAKFIQIQGHDGVEAMDLTGNFVRFGHEMVWKDGRLSQAFRLAAKGTPVLLLVDEALRIPGRQLSVLLSALAPHDEQYQLETGRIVDVVDGIGTEETITCNCANLHVLATTNIGAQYSVDIMDPALKERFTIIRKQMDVTVLQGAVQAFAEKKGFKGADVIAAQCVTFFQDMVRLKANGFADDLPNPRTMLRAVDFAETAADVKAGVQQQVLTWVARDIDGTPVAEQVEHVTAAINKAFK